MIDVRAAEIFFVKFIENLVLWKRVVFAIKCLNLLAINKKYIARYVSVINLIIFPEDKNIYMIFKISRQSLYYFNIFIPKHLFV